MNSDKEILLYFMIFIMFITMVILILRHIIVKKQKEALIKKQHKHKTNADGTDICCIFDDSAPEKYETNVDGIGEIYSPKLYFPDLITSFVQNMKKTNIKLPPDEVDEMQEALKKIAKKETSIELARVMRYMYPSAVSIPIKKRIVAAWWLVFDQIKELDSLKKCKEKEMSTDQYKENKRSGDAEPYTSHSGMTIEEFEAKVYQILDRPFMVEYRSLYKHKKITIKEDPFDQNGEKIAWCIDSSYKKAFIKILNLLLGEKQCTK